MERETGFGASRWDPKPNVRSAPRGVVRRAHHPSNHPERSRGADVPRYSLGTFHPQDARRSLQIHIASIMKKSGAGDGIWRLTLGPQTQRSVGPSRRFRSSLFARNFSSTGCAPLPSNPYCFDHEKIWSGRRDLNPRPQPWQGCTLPLSYSRK